MSIIDSIVEVIVGFSSAVWEVMVSGLTELSRAFYTTGAEGGLTFVGTVLFIGLGLTLTYFVLSFITRLVRT